MALQAPCLHVVRLYRMCGLACASLCWQCSKRLMLCVMLSEVPSWRWSMGSWLTGLVSVRLR